MHLLFNSMRSQHPDNICSLLPRMWSSNDMESSRGFDRATNGRRLEQQRVRRCSLSCCCFGRGVFTAHLILTTTLITVANHCRRGEHIVTVKTHYPQSNGILVPFDDKIKRVFIVVRNPLKSIPSFFNHIYEMRNHLPVHSKRPPLEEWLKWRDAYVDTEIAEYKKFMT